MELLERARFREESIVQDFYENGMAELVNTLHVQTARSSCLFLGPQTDTRNKKEKPQCIVKVSFPETSEVYLRNGSVHKS